MTLLKKILLSYVGLAILFHPFPLFAQQTERVAYDRQLISKKASTSEDVGIAFLKMANNYPNFSKLVELSDAYKAMDPMAQQDYQAKTVSRLQTSYLAFSPRKSDLIIRSKMTVNFLRLADGQGTLKMKTFGHDPIYFPYFFGGYPIALIVKDMDVFKDLRLSKEETDIVYSRLSLSGNVTLLMQVYPVAADDKKPMTFDNVDQYPLLAEIGYIGLFNDQTDQIWAWKNTKFLNQKMMGGDNRPIIDLMPNIK